MLDVIICIPTKRPPPISTLGAYATTPYNVLVVADPDVYDAHYDYYRDIPGIQVRKGVHGLGAQCAECYRQAAKAGFDWWFRLDDDLASPKTFVHKDGTYPLLSDVIEQARLCADETQTTLVGFHNGSNRHWMKEGFHRTYGLVHGGGCLSISSENPDPTFVDSRLVRADDVYRSCAHRRRDGAVGRVAHIGFDKRSSTTNQTSVPTSQEAVDATRDLILSRFAGMVTCTGTRSILGGSLIIPNWRMRKETK